MPNDVAPSDPGRPRLAQALERYYNRSEAYQQVMSSHDSSYFESYIRLLARYAEGAVSLLDAGCGAGSSTFAIAERFPHLSCVGVDISRGSINHARREYGRPNLRYEVGDLAALPFDDDSFSICATFDCLEHVPDLPRALQELMRIVAHGGYLVVKGPNHLSPLTTFIDTVRIRHRYPFTQSWPDNFPRLSFEIRHLLRGWLGKVEFVEREPDLSDSVRVGDDADAVNEMSNLYLRNYFKGAGWEVLDVAWPRSWTIAGRLLCRMLPALSSMGIVARKPVERRRHAADGAP
jgi:ubiquinone/menaquinone biosynthesis C-methylase UbiE